MKVLGWDKKKIRTGENPLVSVLGNILMYKSDTLYVPGVTHTDAESRQYCKRSRVNLEKKILQLLLLMMMMIMMMMMILMRRRRRTMMMMIIRMMTMTTMMIMKGRKKRKMGLIIMIITTTMSVAVVAWSI
jgi:lipopolysaccharide export LptBFGC system permease protein LptF